MTDSERSDGGTAAFSNRGIFRTREAVVVRRRRRRRSKRVPDSRWEARPSRRRYARIVFVSLGVLLLMAVGLLFGLAGREDPSGRGYSPMGRPLQVLAFRVG